MSSSIKKFQLNQFVFNKVPQRLKAEVLNEYERIKAKDVKTEHDNLFLMMVRNKLKATKMRIVGTHKPTGITKSWIFENEKTNTNKLAEELIQEVRRIRNDARNIFISQLKSFDGADYETIGGVMKLPNQINAIAKNTTIRNPLKAKKPRSKSVNYIGVELEFNQNVVGETCETIGQMLNDAGLSRYVCVGVDGSCGFEVRVLLEENNFIEPLTKILELLKAKGFTTDNRCGTHVHLDMRNRDVKASYKKLFLSQTLLRKFLAANRKTNQYCRKNINSDFDSEAQTGDRYRAINAQSYSKFRTLEVRMHQGTLNASSLIPWIKLLLKIVNHKGELSQAGVRTLKQASANYNIEPELFVELQQRILSRGA